MREEVAALPLPATLGSVCIALRTCKAALDAHADAGYSRLTTNVVSDNGASAGQLEIFRSLSLSSPAEMMDERRGDFEGACLSLVSRGSAGDIMLSSWGEVKQELSEVFIFAAVDIEASSNSQFQERDTATLVKGGVPMLSTRTKSLHSSPKRAMPKRAHRRSPKKALATPKKILSAAAMAHGSLSMESFREMIKRRIGASKYKRIFQQAEILPSKLAPNSAARRLDEQIRQKESERRPHARAEEILAARERADREREARESAMRLMRPLTPEEQRTVDSAIEGIGPPTEILARQDADSVQRGSLQTLRPGQWLNDEIINYFLKNCLAKRDEKLCAKDPGRRRSHFFNSFFVQTMFDEKNNNGDLRGKYNYKNVKRWSKKVPGKDIFNLKYIVCPINLDNLHWTSAVVYMEKKRIQYYDSMGGTDQAKLEGLLQYLKDEFHAKKGGELDVSEWELVRCTRDTPKQRNGFDCGVFTCMFCDFISKDCPLVFTQEHIDQCRERIALSILRNCAIE